MAEDSVNEAAVDLSSLGSFDFAPSWAAGDRVVSQAGRGGFRDDGGDGRGDRDSRARFPRRGDGERRGGAGGRPPRRDGFAERGGAPRDDRQRRAPGREGRDGRPPRGGFARREYVKPLEAEVRILPGPKELGGIIRKVQTSYVAYPLKQIALFFLDHREACNVKVAPKDPQVRFHVCKACSQSFLSPEALDAHLLSAHLGDYYTAEETEVEPPSGQFGCVVKCGVTGELIGPPNLHGYNAAVREMAQKLGMDEGAYRARLETVRDPETVEAWRKSATRKTLYRLKAAGGEAQADAAEASATPAMEREQAEAAFRRDIMPQLRGTSKTSDMTLEQALKSQDLPYLFAVRDAVARERRFPASLFFALRGAFHHRKLAFFRANEAHGQEFVCAVKPSPLDTAHAIPEVVAVVWYVEEHPFCSVGDLPPEMKGHLGWLVEKGHVVQYFNGLLAMPEANPKFRNSPPRKEKAPAHEAATAAEAPVEAPAEAPVEAPAEASAEAPVAEAPAESPVGDAVDVKKEEVSDEAADKLA